MLLVPMGTMVMAMVMMMHPLTYCCWPLRHALTDGLVCRGIAHFITDHLWHHLISHLHLLLWHHGLLRHRHCARHNNFLGLDLRHVHKPLHRLTDDHWPGHNNFLHLNLWYIHEPLHRLGH